MSDFLQVAQHEAAHAATALLEGLDVPEVRSGRVTGLTRSVFRVDDPRDPIQRAETRVRIALMAVLISPGNFEANGDEDVASAYRCAAAVTRGDGVDAWIAARSDECHALMRTEEFRRLHAQLVRQLVVRGSLRGLEAVT